MAKKKYASDEALRNKIHQLFEYRKLNELLHISGLDQQQEMVDHLIHIQTQIYLLDAYLESHWELDNEKLDTYWKQIRDSLRELGYSDECHEALLKDIRRYEKIEMNCRKDTWPTSISFRKFYTIKSCDVRLIRHLIYAAAPELKKTWKEKVWTYYDLITEINDDISDVEEDLPTYNGNRFLISMLRKGDRKTEKQYKAFIREVEEKANRYFAQHPKQEVHRELHEWIGARAKETKALLKEVTTNPDMGHLSSSSLLIHMK